MLSLADFFIITNPAIETGTDTLGGETLAKLLATIIRALVVAGGLTMLFYLIKGGYAWITAGGKPDNLEKARNEILHAISGMIILAAVIALVSLLGALLGINLLNINIPGVADL